MEEKWQQSGLPLASSPLSLPPHHSVQACLPPNTKSPLFSLLLFSSLPSSPPHHITFQHSATSQLRHHFALHFQSPSITTSIHTPAIPSSCIACPPSLPLPCSVSCPLPPSTHLNHLLILPRHPSVGRFADLVWRLRPRSGDCHRDHHDHRRLHFSRLDSNHVLHQERNDTLGHGISQAQRHFRTREHLFAFDAGTNAHSIMVHDCGATREPGLSHAAAIINHFSGIPHLVVRVAQLCFSVISHIRAKQVDQAGLCHFTRIAGHLCIDIDQVQPLCLANDICLPDINGANHLPLPTQQQDRNLCSRLLVTQAYGGNGPERC